MNDPASLTDSGFMPPVENTKEKAELPFEYEPLAPNGLVIVNTLLATWQPPAELLIGDVVEVIVQVPSMS